MRKKLIGLALTGVLLSPAMAFAGGSTDAALGLGAFAVFNQILGGVGVFGGGAPAVYAAPARVYVAPPPVYVAPPPVVYAPPPPVIVPWPPHAYYRYHHHHPYVRYAPPPAYRRW